MKLTHILLLALILSATACENRSEAPIEEAPAVEEEMHHDGMDDAGATIEEVDSTAAEHHADSTETGHEGAEGDDTKDHGEGEDTSQY